MVQVANIYTIESQKYYSREKYVMVLAHLVQKGLYDPKFFDEHQYIIMDNGLYEKAQVSTNLQDLIDLVETSGIPVSEIIVPDVLNNCDANIELFKQNLDTMLRYRNKYSFMFVAQAKNYAELYKALNFIKQFKRLFPITVGISKLCPFDRDSEEAIGLYKDCPFPIHFLGIKHTFAELLPVKHIIRSCDTSQLMFIAKHEISYNMDLVSYSRIGRGEDVNLEDQDEWTGEEVYHLIKLERESFGVYGLL